MENKDQFTYHYSATNAREVENIRKKYLPREESKLDIIRKLDKRVNTAGMIPSLCLGIIGVLVFGIGMCFGLDVFGGSDWLTVLFMGLGAVIMAPAYYIYKRISAKTRAELSPKILRLSEEMMNNDNH